jgi:hypothetical protein
MPEGNHIAGHETSDINSRGAAWFGLALALSVVVIALIIWKMERALDPTGPSAPYSPNISPPKFQSPSPVLQTSVTDDLQSFRAQEENALQSYDWVDRKAGVIRIPVERAKTLILQRGLPATATTMPLPGPPTPPATQSPILNPGGTP